MPIRILREKSSRRHRGYGIPGPSGTMRLKTATVRLPRNRRASAMTQSHQDGSSLPTDIIDHTAPRARGTPPSHTTHTNQRHASEPPSSSSRQAAFDRPPDPRYRYTDPPAPQRRASMDQSRRPSTEAESFTTQRELQPTFSPNIVRTPGHYASPPPSRNSNSRNARSSSVDSTLSARMEQLSTGPNPPVRHSSMPQVPSGYSSASSSAMTGASHYVEEPTALLSPLMMNTPKPASRSMSRHSSVPAASLGPIPESSPSSSSYQTSSSRGTSRQSSRHTSPATSSSDRHVTPPHTTRLSNPLPPPPAEIRYPLPPPQRRSPPSGYRTRVRKGFWNRRGDHLTMEGYIVYAPRDQANPPELVDYPAVNEGYRTIWMCSRGMCQGRNSPSPSPARVSRPVVHMECESSLGSFVSCADGCPVCYV
ncbi:hypothetical protein BD779DRAFT_619373 [Infundibulicybe gibba]|nr:hypothetical protein BD779DRAFT_619373 [Infundibulicybe gibba]